MFGFRNSMTPLGGVINQTFEHSQMGCIRLHKSPYGWNVKTSSGNKLTTIKYFHHLQNFFFTITGNELKIKCTNK
jgi:hypothetical protein